MVEQKNKWLHFHSTEYESVIKMELLFLQIQQTEIEPGVRVFQSEPISLSLKQRPH